MYRREITLSPDGHKIVEIEDLQIINGGQTTASLTSAVLKDKLSLDNIFVPMKMTVVKNDDYDTMIQIYPSMRIVRILLLMRTFL